MGEHEGWAQPSGPMLNGLLPKEAASVTRPLDRKRWSKAEERVAELIVCIQPNKPSEERRNAVAEYVQRLITKCFSCQVFTFGSVPLKTYLPDGDIDLTTFCKNPNLKDTWATEVRDMLMNEEKSENAEFRVKEVQYIQAEVKLIKCLVENIVVDISFNQLGGLCTLCFLEEVDHLISKDHLFKRSIILIKAWCYYESRILGAHHGLISTYALETLVLYIFHVFNNSFVGPLEVLYRFLEFFSSFDWDNFCVSLRGPVRITSLPDMTAEPPRKDNRELLLSKLFLDACSSVYAVFPSGQENQGQPFLSKHFNVVDPLRTNNNLGRSVSKGNFYRIRSAFAFGAKRLARLLECPEENIIMEVDQFFTNTWERHASGCRPDAPGTPICLHRSLNADNIDTSENSKTSSSIKTKNESSTNQEPSAEVTRFFHRFPSQHGYQPSQTVSRSSNMVTFSRNQILRNYRDQTSTKVPDLAAENIISPEGLNTDTDAKSSRIDHVMNEARGRYQFARTRSSPELTDASNEVTSRGRHSRVSDGKAEVVPKSDYSRRKNSGSEMTGIHGARSSTGDPPSMKHKSFRQGPDTSFNSTIPSSNYHDEAALGLMREELASVADSREMHQEEQDLVNMMASSKLHGGLIQMPTNFAPHHLLQTSPVLASMGYQKNLVGMVPTNIPLVGSPWGSQAQFAQQLVSSPLSPYFPSVGLAPNTESTFDVSNGNSDLTESNQEADCGFWHDDHEGGNRGFGSDNGGSQMLQSDDNKQSTSIGFSYVPASQVNNPVSSFVRGQHRLARGREEQNDSFQYQNNRVENVPLVERNSSLRNLPTLQASSSRSKASSESSWDASVKTSKSVRDRRGRKAPSAVTSVVYGKGKNGWQYESAPVSHGSSQADDDSRDWISLSTVDTEIEERSMGSTPVASPHLRSHHIPNCEPSRTCGSESGLHLSPMLVGSGSHQRAMDNSGVVPVTFYLTGPPVPFLTMLPVYNLPTESGKSEGSTSNFDREDALDNSRINQSDQNFDSAESLDQSEILSRSNSNKHASPMDPSEQPCEEHKFDILHSDFISHWHNLQYGRFCQNPRYYGPIIHPSPIMVPPVYLQGHFPWDGPGRPPSPNSNIYSQLMSKGPRLLPVAPLQPGSSRPASVYQRYGDEVPKYRGGTGTYLPSPKASLRSSNTRNQRGNYHYERNDHHIDREGSWNNGTRPRASGRSYSRSQVDKLNSRSERLVSSDSRAEKPWEFYRHNSFPGYQSQNGPFAAANSTNNVSANMAYGMYPLPAVNSNGVTPSGPSVPSVVMLYPYDNNVGYNSSAEQLEFGTLGPVHFSGSTEVSQIEERSLARGVYDQHRFQGGSPAHSSPDQPSSPHLQR